MIRFDSIAFTQGDFHLTNLSFQVPKGAYAVLMGPTGCGKTTILELLCGLRTPMLGRIQINDRDITQLTPGARGVGYVPQDSALFPTLSVGEQIAFSLRVRRLPDQQVATRVSELAELLNIGHLLARRPEDLSGGERQRVALGRALAFRPEVLCLDEPLAALDEDMHSEMCALLQTVHSQTGVTALHVTHSAQEAERLSTHQLRFENGRIQDTTPDPSKA